MEFEPGKLYSMLDILGGNFVCDGCGAETEKTLTPEMAVREARKAGWQVESLEGGKDLCPKCRPNGTA